MVVARIAVVAAVCAALAIAGCASRSLPPLQPGAPRFPDFVYPAAPDVLGDARLRARHQTAWRYLQAGDLGTAAREFADIARRTAGFYPAEAALGYVRMAESRPNEALPLFDRVLQRVPRYAPALAGRGEALAAKGQPDAAIASFEAARAADPGLADLGRRIEVLRFARVNDLVSTANRAAAAGKLDEARRGYEAALAASPDSSFLLRDLGLVELRAGAVGPAAEHLRRAVQVDREDVRAWTGLAEAAERAGDTLEALAALERIVELAPSEQARRNLARARERAELAKLPEQYRAIPSLSQVTRGDLAALVGVRLVPVLPAAQRGSTPIVTDARTHWAATWILAAIRTGLMEAFPNHTFQPRNPVRRADLAAVVSRSLAVLGVAAPRGGGRPTMTDVAPDHLGYPAAASAVASGIMPLLDGGAFRPSRPVTGTEAVEAIARLEALARRQTRRPAGRP